MIGYFIFHAHIKSFLFYREDNADRKTTTEAYHKNRQGEDSVDDVLKGSDFE